MKVDKNKQKANSLNFKNALKDLVEKFHIQDIEEGLNEVFYKSFL